MTETALTFYQWMTSDPVGISVLSFIRNLIYLLVIYPVLRWMMNDIFTMLNRGINIDPKENIWSALEKGSVPVAIYLGFRVFGVLYVVGNIASAFIK